MTDANRPAVKHDTEKTRLDLLPPEMIEAVGQVMTFGAATYGDRNWERGMAWGRLYAAALRHMNAWQGGEDRDRETGMSHLWHATTCLVFLLTYEARGIGTDDRPEIAP